MADSTVAGIITACATVLIAAGGVITAIGVLIPILRGTRANTAAVAATQAAVGEVHTIVNQQRTDGQRYQAALVAALERHGIEVPADQSLAVAPPATATPPGGAGVAVGADASSAVVPLTVPVPTTLTVSVTPPK